MYLLGKEILHQIIKKKKYLYFDTLIVVNKNIKATNYKRYKWKKIMQNKTKIIDHKYSKNLAMMCLNQTKQMSKVNIKYYIFS